MNEPRVYKNSPFMLVLLILVFGGLFFALFFVTGDIVDSDQIVMILFALAFGLLFLFILFTATSQIIISDDEISTKNLFGTKTLRWSEINRVFGRGYSIKLQNFDGDVTVAPSPQLTGYEEVVNWIGVKRPDLFSPQEYGEMTKSWAGTLLLPVIGLLLIGLGFFVLTVATDTLFPFLMLTVIGLVFIGMTFTTPQAITIQGNSIVIGYLFNQKTLAANEIASVDLRYTQTRNGKNYFVAVTLTNKMVMRISGLSPNLPVMYLVLGNWHKKNASIGQINKQN